MSASERWLHEEMGARVAPLTARFERLTRDSGDPQHSSHRYADLLALRAAVETEAMAALYARAETLASLEKLAEGGETEGPGVAVRKARAAGWLETADALAALGAKIGVEQMRIIGGGT